MYLAHIIILLILILMLALIVKEEARARKDITHGIANKYWVLREKRKFVRFNEGLKIRYNRIESGTRPADSKIRDISRKGLCVSSYEKFKEKDSLEIEIEVPGFSKPVKATGSVIWVKELRSNDDHGRRIFYTGIKFGNINPESEAILITHLNTLKRP